MTPAFIVRPARWNEDAAAIAYVRRKVFIDEQGVPESLEWENADPECLWFVATTSNGEVIGIGRLTPEGRIGRMAVMPAWRRRGVGAGILVAAIQAARERGQALIELSAQTRAIPFYLRHGFTVQGDDFVDAGIPHRAMTLELGVFS